MYKLYVLILLFILPIFAEVGFKGRPITNVIMMQSGYTLNKGEFIYGIGLIEYGLSDRWQIGTDILLTFMGKYYNVMGKMTISQSENMAFAAALGLNYDGDSQRFIVTPLVSYSRTISPDVGLHFAGQFRIAQDKNLEMEEGIPDFMAYFSTAVDYNVSTITKLLTETGYDFVNKGYYVSGGVLFGWEDLRVKLGIGYYHPEPYYMGTLPYGLWFRFR